MVDNVETYVVFAYSTPMSRFFEMVDIDTGEVIWEFRQDDLENAIKEGFETLEGFYSLHYQTMPSGAKHCFVVDQFSKKYVDAGWLKPEKKEYKRGGRKTRVTIDMDKIAPLPKEERMAVVDLAAYIRKDGSLGTKGGRKVSERMAINILNGGDSCGYDIWNSLKDKGIVKIEDGKIFINNKYVFRG